MSEPECTICGNPMRPWFRVPGDWRRPSSTETYSLFWCDRCEFGRQEPMPDEAQIAKNFDVEYAPFNPNNPDESDATGGDRSFLSRLLVHLAWRRDEGVEDSAAWLRRQVGPPPRKVCDLGCGIGATLKEMRGAGYEVVGVEPVPRARELAIAQGFRVFPGTAESFPDELRAEKFDAVFMRHMLHLCRDPLLAVKNAASLLSKDGVVIIETTNNKSLGFEHAGLAWRWLDVPRHVSFFTPGSLRAICERADLRVRGTEYNGYTRQFLSPWIWDEQRIHDFFEARPKLGGPLPKRNSPIRAWQLLSETAFAPPERKYDSVRVLASPSPAARTPTN